MYLIFIILAAMAYSVQKVLIYDFHRCIFKDSNPIFWNPVVAIEKAKRIFGMRIEALHLSQILVLVFLQASIVLSHTSPFDLDFLNMDGWIEFTLCWIFFIVVHKTFYKKLIDKTIGSDQRGQS